MAVCQTTARKRSDGFTPKLGPSTRPKTFRWYNVVCFNVGSMAFRLWSSTYQNPTCTRCRLSRHPPTVRQSVFLSICPMCIVQRGFSARELHPGAHASIETWLICAMAKFWQDIGARPDVYVSFSLNADSSCRATLVRCGDAGSLWSVRYLWFLVF